MNSLSVPTLLLVIAIVSAMCSLITYTVWRINRRMQGLLPWFLGSLASTIGFFAAFPFAQLSGVEKYMTVLNNSLALIGALLMLEGALQFRGHPSASRWRWGLFLIPFLVAAIWFSREDPALRHLVHDAMSAPILLAVAFTMLWRTSGKTLRIYALAALFPALMGCSLLMRGSFALQALGDPALSLDKPRAVTFLLIILCIMGWTFGITVACYFREHLNMLQMAVEDVLTGLPNRRNIDQTLEQTLQRARRHDEPFAVLLMDMNQFKQVNDQFGHHVGDLLLVEIARRLRGFLREADFAGRLGGDEFLIIVHGAEDFERAQRARERLRYAVEGPVALGGSTAITIRAAIGVALWPAQGQDVDELMRAADADMYADKKSAHC